MSSGCWLPPRRTLLLQASCVCIVALLAAVILYWFMGVGPSREEDAMSRHIIIPAAAKHTATVIFLHGLGDTGHGWSMAFQAIRQPHIRYICPNAEAIPVTLNAKFVMPAWFDILALGEGPEDEDGIKKASSLVHNLIAEEERLGIASNRIVLGGFSQGGGLALYSALTLAKPLAGVVALSSWLPLHRSFPQEIKGNREMSCLQGHGAQDPMVNVVWGEKTRDLLKSLLPTANYTWRRYEGLGHSSSEAEMQDVKAFISKQLPAT